MATKNDSKEKKPTQNDVEAVAELLTEEQFERRQRQRNKEKLNRVTRVAGTIAIILLAYVGIFDALFEMSYFGWLFTRGQHRAIWEQMKNVLDVNEGNFLGPIYDNAVRGMYDKDMIMAKLGFTVLLIASFILIVYFITYNVVDLIAMIKSMVLTGKNITRDLSGNVKDTVESFKKDGQKPAATRKRRPSLFSKEELDEMNVEDEEKRERRPRRRKESDASEFEGYSPEQLDALLSGKTIEEVSDIEETQEEV